MASRKLQKYPNISLDINDFLPCRDPAELFDTTGSMHIEIGSGKGTFILAQAAAQPDCIFLGIDWASKYYRYAVDRLGRWGIKNAKMLRADAADLFANCLTDSCIDVLHIYFPDPWPKKRHHKRRFINDANFANVLRTLKTNGKVQIATDHAGYFEQITEVLEKQLRAGTVENTEFIKAAGAKENEIVGTNFERKYIKDGRKVYTAAIKKL
jgi:tRNA (guanine-N7-)-methyltransferase